MGPNGKKALIAVVLFAAAGGVYWYTSREPDLKALNSEEAPQPLWTCVKCGHQWQPEQSDVERTISGRTRSSPGEAREMTRMAAEQVPVLTCPKCNEKAAVVSANRCPVHECSYPNAMPDGSPGKCPKCEPS